MIQAKILPGYWHDRLAVNAEVAIFHQWKQLEASGSIENFRIAAGEAEGFREGWFFSDSDAFKWLDAAARIFATYPSQRLADLMDDFIALIGRAQEPDGYLFTYNQIHFPDSRWINLQIEHELYCHGHLIEAGVSHHEATKRSDLLAIAQRAADRIVTDFKGKGPAYTPGHQEIEIALLRLYRLTGQADYLECARQLIEQRGRNRVFGLLLFQQNASVEKRKNFVSEQRQTYLSAHPDYSPFQVPAGNEAKKPWNIALRYTLNAITGKYFQQHSPIRSQTIPVGHSVRFAYLEIAVAMLARESGDSSLIASLELAWDRMVSRRMYITGGIGSLPTLEGFGNDYELDPEFAYAETCAALASIFWSWEMLQLTGQAKYSDLFEWQLYNAAGVGMGIDGATYFYNNPLSCRGGVERKAWYEVPCCPSNISRTWADLGKRLFTNDKRNIWVHQYVNSEVALDACGDVILRVESELPWQGKVRIKVAPREPQKFSLHLRTPSWAKGTSVKINEEEQSLPAPNPSQPYQTASGYDPRVSHFLEIKRIWAPGDVVELEFKTDIQLRHAHPKVRKHKGTIAITAGPLVYCLESNDNLGVDIFNVRIDPTSLAYHFDPDLLGGTNVVTAKALDSTPLVFIPYFLWGNRGSSQMTVWINT